MSNTYYNVQLKNPKEEEQFWYPLTLKSNVVDLTDFNGASALASGTNGLVPAPSAGDQTKFLRGDGTWQDAGGGGGSYTLPHATSSALGGIKIGYTETGSNYAVALDSNDKAYVNVPWTDTEYKTSLNDISYPSSPASGAISLGSWYAPTTAGTSTNLFLKWDTTNSKPIWTTLSSILGSTSSNLLLGDGSTLTKAITTTKINGTSYTALSDTGSAQTQTDSIYAPISGTTSISGANAANQLLLSVGSTSAPTWSSFAFPSLAGTIQMLTYVGGTGWSLANITDTKNTVGAGPNTANHVLYLIGVAADSTTDDNFYTKSYCPTQANYIGTDNYLYSRSGSSTSARVINSLGNGLARDSVQTNRISLKTASNNEIGGIKVGAVKNSTVTASTTDTDANKRYAVLKDSNDLAYVNVPWTGGSGSIPGVASVNGDNPGLLQVTADADPDKVYINTEYVTAIPVFYSDGSKENAKIYIYDKGYDGELPYSLPECYVESEEKVFTGHYVNLEDVINGLIRRSRLLAILKDALDNYKPE